MDSTLIYLEQNWKFHLTGASDVDSTGTLGGADEAWFKGYDDSAWEPVTIPHDWSVSLPFSEAYSSGTGYLAGGIGWYRVRFTLPESLRGHKIFLCFDGVYKNSQVWCNSYYLGKRPNGYVPFRYDISSQAVFGAEENVVSVKVTHTDLADSRWFTGSGITRKVAVLAEEPVHPAENGIFFSTLYLDDSKAALCEVSHSLVNDSDRRERVSIRSALFSPDGKEVLTLTAEADFAPFEQKAVSLNGSIKNPALWSPQSPSLYTLVCSLSRGGSAYYTVFRQKVGIRTILFDPDKGFFLNGREMKLKGVCVHHDGGCLGAAMQPQIWQRRLTVLKEGGCNAIRTSHNPHMPELYELCDRMGFLVMDEAFDEWENAKNKWSTGHNVYPPKHQGYYEDFPAWHEADLTAMVRRDRNHPCVILWSIGNEIDYPNDPYCHPLFQEMTGNNDSGKPASERAYHPSRPNMERLAVIAGQLCAIVKKSDTTRPVTLAAAFPELSSRLHYFDSLDVVGYNYKEHLYEEDHKRFPDKPFLGSENGHSYKAWLAVKENPYISGQFLWTGIDYLGEAHGWPIHGSSAGLLTLAGYPKPAYYKHQAYWCDAPAASLVTCPCQGESDTLTEGNEPGMNRPAMDEWVPTSESWNYEPGQRLLVRCYTNQPCAELLLNGRSLGSQTTLTEAGCMDWIVTYEPGTLTVNGYDGQDTSSEAPIVTHSLETAGPAARIRLSRWSETPQWGEPDDGRTQHAYLEQVEITVTDQDGRRVPGDRTLLRAQVSGGVLAGLENGDLADHTPYTAPCRAALDGRLIAYVRRDGQSPVLLTVAADGLPDASLTL